MKHNERVKLGIDYYKPLKKLQLAKTWRKLKRVKIYRLIVYSHDHLCFSFLAMELIVLLLFELENVF